MFGLWLGFVGLETGLGNLAHYCAGQRVQSEKNQTEKKELEETEYIPEGLSFAAEPAEVLLAVGEESSTGPLLV